MNRRMGIIWGLFGIMVLLQLYFPTRWILENEETLSEGTPYRFRVRPIDPSDPIRGNYVRINYEADRIRIDDMEEWDEGDEVFVSFELNDDGFVELKEVSKEPFDETPYFQSGVQSVIKRPSERTAIMYLDHPFDRFYIDKEAAQKAEDLLFERTPDDTEESYAIVKILDGQASLEDLVVQGTSIRELVGEGRGQ